MSRSGWRLSPRSCGAAAAAASRSTICMLSMRSSVYHASKCAACSSSHLKLRTTTRYDFCWSAPPLTLRLSTLQRNDNRPCCLTCSVTTSTRTCRSLCKLSQYSQGRMDVTMRTSRVISLASSANSCDWLPGNEIKIAGVFPTCIRPASTLMNRDSTPLHFTNLHCAALLFAAVLPQKSLTPPAGPPLLCRQCPQSRLVGRRPLSLQHMS